MNPFTVLADLVKNKFNPGLISPVATSQTYPNKEAMLMQQFEDTVDLKDALESELKYQPLINAQATAKGGGWIPQRPQKLSEMTWKGQAPQGQVLGANADFETLKDLAKSKALERGFHPAPIVSQMASESERGNSRFARERNNLFGIGAFDSNLSNTHRYENPEQSIDAYLELISTDPRYTQAYQQRSDPNAYIKAIKAAGYATDPNYVWKIQNTPEWRQMMQ